MSLCGWAQSKTQCVFLVMTDGWRCDEMFNGATEALLSNTSDVVKQQFGQGTSEERRNALMPFIWNELVPHGQIYGNRTYGNNVNLTNPYHFSNPGYSEIITGFADPQINHNDKIYNPNVNVFEILNQSPKLKNKVAAFGSWDLFPYIFNVKRNNLPVNAGYINAEGKKLSKNEKLLNNLQNDIPAQFNGVRYDALTDAFAMEYIKREKPRVVFISLGETDDIAHTGNYAAYLQAGHRFDQYVKDLWNYINKDPFYKNRTTLIVTTDHGRGHADNAWTSHGNQFPGSDQTWIAVIGPDTSAKGEIKQSGQHYSNQIAKTIATFLKVPYTPEKGCGDAILEMYK
ncbi:MAG: alkaline phosphatase family protein [Bacteroidota bacterium]|nr:alkaline phosphatase family protein [Bacteroidota bacterium]MDP4205583.1 alkaline phosphatase family protein [Bacteroidota bacterium]